MLHHTPLANNAIEWASVSLKYEYDEELDRKTVRLWTRPARHPDGSIIPAEVFGAVQRKVASVIGPMLERHLIRLVARIRKADKVCPIFIFPSDFLCIVILHLS